jgi:hypothetical protein
MGQAFAVTICREVLALLCEHLKAPGYAAVEAGRASNAVHPVVAFKDALRVEFAPISPTHCTSYVPSHEA